MNSPFFQPFDPKTSWALTRSPLLDVRNRSNQSIIKAVKPFSNKLLILFKVHFYMVPDLKNRLSLIFGMFFQPAFDDVDH